MTELHLVPPEPEIDRTTGIGGSDIARIVGVSPYEGPFEVYLEKTGQAPPLVENEAIYWGRKLQGLILRRYAERENCEGKVVELFDKGLRHHERTFQIGHPDGIRLDRIRLLEAKAPGLRQAWKYGVEGTDQIPEEHLVQTTWYMSLLDYEEADVVVLLGGQDFRVYHVTRDRELEGMLIERGERFWRDHVLAKKPPVISDSDRAKAWLRSNWPKDVEPLRQASVDEIEIVSMLRAARESGEEHETKLGQIKNTLIASIGDAAGIEGPGFRITYKLSKDAQKVDWEAIARELDASQEVIAKHTATKPGSRRFVPTFEGEK